MVTLGREAFEHAARNAGIEDFTLDGEDYTNTGTQAAYLVWCQAVGADNGRPIGWVTRRNGRVHSFSYVQPKGPGSPGWEQQAARGFNMPLPVFPGVPALPPSGLLVVVERLRQALEERYTPAGDVGYAACELERAAACYALQAAGNRDLAFNRFWPWANPIKRHGSTKSLIVAGALILAALDARASKEAATDDQ
ncbi:hypothetical protein [Pseudomonas sp. PNPG3]|uniref:hypothetical protein n=1 Tax=Pseudomonas sp. PNPG3 TaxID=2919497 RepID=UPI001FFC9EE8|nr:hypothetical protein [Pseudomonas sp. PNPG3]MCK2122083.1 hypothetical protein [Pseudomonas sp. PNPG3]